MLGISAVTKLLLIKTTFTKYFKLVACGYFIFYVSRIHSYPDLWNHFKTIHVYIYNFKDSACLKLNFIKLYRHFI